MKIKTIKIDGRSAVKLSLTDGVFATVQRLGQVFKIAVWSSTGTLLTGHNFTKRNLLDWNPEAACMARALMADDPGMVLDKGRDAAGRYATRATDTQCVVLRKARPIDKALFNLGRGLRAAAIAGARQRAQALRKSRAKTRKAALRAQHRAHRAAKSKKGALTHNPFADAVLGAL